MLAQKPCAQARQQRLHWPLWHATHLYRAIPRGLLSNLVPAKKLIHQSDWLALLNFHAALASFFSDYFARNHGNLHQLWQIDLYYLE